MSTLPSVQGKMSVVILGAGITGLAAAYRLAKRNIRPIIIEKEKRVGGLADSYVRERLAVDSSAEPAYITLGGETSDFCQHVWRTGGNCEYEKAYPFHVYYDFIAPHFDREPIPRHKWRASSNCNQKDAANAFDGDIDTCWTTGQRQRRGMYYELDLGGVCEISGICLLFPGCLNDYPDGYRLDVSLDGREWEEVLSVEKDMGSFFWLGERFFWRPGHDRRHIWFEPANVRFLRITQTGYDLTYYWSIHELEIMVK